MFDTFKYNLKYNRKSVTRAVTAWLIFGAIIVVFIFWGLTPRNNGMSAMGGTAALVNGNSVSVADLNDLIERMRRDPRFQQYQSLGGELSQKILEQQAMGQLVEMELIRQETDKQRLWTTDAEVREVIVAIPQFQEEGRFKGEIYRNYLTAVRKTPQEFEDEIRRERSLRRSVELFRAALQPLSFESERQKALGEMKANVEFVRIPVETLVQPERVSQTDVTAYLAQDGNEAKIKASYETRKAEFTTEESVQARHILIKADPSDPTTDEKARVKIEEIAKRAKTEDFAKLAKAVSEDPGSKDKGGDLGFFAKGRMLPEFEKAAFALPVGEVSAPVKTEFGYHLIKVEAKRPANTRPYEEARNEIASQEIAKDRSRVALEALEQALKAGDNAGVAKFLENNKLKWDESGAFAIEADSVPKMGAGDDAIRTAFALTPQKPLHERLIRQGPVAYIMRYKAVPAEKAKDAKASPDLMADFLANRRSEDALRQWIEGLKKSARVSYNEAPHAGTTSGQSPFDM